MATPLNTIFSASLVLAALTLCAAPASALPSSATAAKSHPKAADVLKSTGKAAPARSKKALAAAAAAASAGAASAAAVNEAEPDITGTKVSEYACELGNKITIYTNEQDDAHIALRWKKRLHRLARIGTTTGALRFENPNYGLVWIGIPAKGILLDSKLNRQLANECKNADQAAPILATGQDDKKI